MPTSTLRPNADRTVGSITIVGGAGSAWASLSDNSSATYVTVAGALYSVELGTVAMGALARTKTLTVRVKARANGAGDVAAGFEGEVLTAAGVVVAEVVQNGLTTSEVDYAGVPTVVDLSQAEVDGLWYRSNWLGSLGAVRREIEVYIDLAYVGAPSVVVTSPSGTSFTSSVATVGWTYTPGTDGGPQQRYQVRVFSAAQYGAGGFDPATSPATWESGEVLSSAVSAITSDLPNGTYRAYVRAAQSVNGSPHWSAWAFSAFSLDVDPPDVGSIVATAESGDARIRLDVAQGYASVLDIVASANPGDRARTQAVLAGTWTGNFTVTTYIVASDWTPASSRTLFGNYGVGGGIAAGISVAGLLSLGFSTSGSALRSATSAAPGLVDGQGYWLEFFYDDTAKTARFRKSSDPASRDVSLISWTTISTNAVVGGGSPGTGPNRFSIGSSDQTPYGSSFSEAQFARAEIRDSGGVLRASPNFMPQTPGTTSFVDAQGNTWATENTAAIIAGNETISAALGAPTWDELQIEASYDGEQTWQAIIGSPFDVDGDASWLGYDYEAPPNVNVIYRARALAGASGSTLVSPWSESNVVQWVTDSAWIKLLGDPALNQAVCVRDFPSEEFARPQGVHAVLDRPDLVVTSDALHTRTGSFSIMTETTAERDALLELLTSAGPFLLQLPESQGGAENLYLVPGGLSRTRAPGAERSGLRHRILTVGYTEIARPLAV